MMPDLLPSDISPFEGLSAQAIAAVALIYFVAFSIRGVIGFGSGMPAVLFSSWILDPHHAVLLALTTGAPPREFSSCRPAFATATGRWRFFDRRMRARQTAGRKCPRRA